VRWTSDGWKTTEEIETIDSGLGIHHALLNTAALPAGANVEFTFYWPQAHKWEARNFRSTVA
jgi:glucoamylase